MIGGRKKIFEFYSNGFVNETFMTNDGPSLLARVARIVINIALHWKRHSSVTEKVRKIVDELFMHHNPTQHHKTNRSQNEATLVVEGAFFVAAFSVDYNHIQCTSTLFDQ